MDYNFTIYISIAIGIIIGCLGYIIGKLHSFDKDITTIYEIMWYQLDRTGLLPDEYYEEYEEDDNE